MINIPGKFCKHNTDVTDYPCVDCTALRLLSLFDAWFDQYVSYVSMILDIAAKLNGYGSEAEEMAALTTVMQALDSMVHNHAKEE